MAKRNTDSHGTLFLLVVLAVAVGLLVGFKIIKPLVDQGRGVVIINPVGEKKQLTVGKHTLAVEVRDTDAGRELGLSGRTGLAENEGMLFVFQSKQQPLFWMKDMVMALDMIWIADGRILQIDENVPPPTKEQPRVVTRMPTGLVDQVLEVASGWVQRHGVVVGDSVSLGE